MEGTCLVEPYLILFQSIFLCLLLTFQGEIINGIDCQNEIYDPLFYLPVFTNLLADNNIVACHKVVHSGALALAIIACSSICEQIRMAAYTVISRFYFHLEATR